jgi:phage terminase large subunit-like protein
VWATRLEDGRIALRAKIWTTRHDQVGEYVDGGTMRLELVERFILDELKPRHRIREIAYDPTYFGRSAELIEKVGRLRGRLVEMPPWHNHTAAAWEEFKQLAIEGRLCHDGDPGFAAHVAAAGQVMTANGPRVRKTASGKIDALAAAVLAVSRCQLNTKPTRRRPGVFWMDPDESDSKPEVGRDDAGLYDDFGVRTDDRDG